MDGTESQLPVRGSNEAMIFEGLKRFLKRSQFLVALVMAARASKRVGIEECRKIAWIRARSRTINSYLKSHHIRKLQIGSGHNFLQGWLNTEFSPRSREYVFLDVTELFPFKDNTFDYLFSEHLIEHITYKDGLSMLRECYRVLKPGGRIRIATPDLEKLIGLYTPEKSDLQKHYIQQHYITWDLDKKFPARGGCLESFVINNFFRSWGHQFIYDRATLKSAMEEVGFSAIISYAPGESEDENLRAIESHGKIIGEDMNHFETMVLEAKRPVMLTAPG